MRNFVIILMSCLLAACAGSGEHLKGDRFEEIEVYERHAGAAEPWVRYNNIRNWWKVGFHSVVFEVNRSRHYLVDLVGSCSLDLDDAVTLQLVTTRNNSLSQFDRLIVGHQSCHIQSIHPLDYDAVTAELESDGKSASEPAGTVSVQSESQSSGGT